MIEPLEPDDTALLVHQENVWSVRSIRSLRSGTRDGANGEVQWSPGTRRCVAYDFQFRAIKRVLSTGALIVLTSHKADRFVDLHDRPAPINVGQLRPV